jgi:hypothetical protein
LATRLLSRPIDRAIVLFTRTIGRRRQHRLLPAADMGIGLAIALSYSRELIYPLESRFWKVPWNQPNVPLQVATLVLLFFAVIGARAIFALPIASAPTGFSNPPPYRVRRLISGPCGRRSTRSPRFPSG